MAQMIRSKSKATKIAYDILGIPENMKEVKKTPKEQRRERILEADETSFVR
jgi:hypothetical protein